jgi:hypothetical protein
MLAELLNQIFTFIMKLAGPDADLQATLDAILDFFAGLGL